MKRDFRAIFSVNFLKHTVYIPKIIFRMKNWVEFILNYVGVKHDAKFYEFRTGLRINVKEMLDTSTISVIFIKDEYGSIEDNSTIIDIGANIGVFSLYALDTLKNTKVYAYEPMKSTYNVLVKNIKINNFQNKIIPFQLGVSSKKGKQKLYTGSGSPFSSMYSELYPEKNKTYEVIKTITLKEVFEKNKIKKCDFLKMDCEGAEFEILYTVPKKYLEKIGKLRLEYHNMKKKKNNIKELTRFLEKNGFILEKKRKDSGNTGIAWFKKINF